MPWKEKSVISEKIKFIGRLIDGERMTDLCKEFGIARKTGYKILERYEENGVNGLENKSSSAINRPNKTPVLMEKKIKLVKKKFPTWGAPKIKSYLEKNNPYLKIPAKSTIHSILDKNNLVLKKKKRSRYKSNGSQLTDALAPNDIWCTDFKGHFKLGNKKYCYPLTLTDQFSRYLFSCEGLENTKAENTFEIYERVFKEFGIPNIIRSDNGVPFASTSVFGLTTLSVWWLRLGIKLERIKPGNPQENGQHERMHRTLKESTLKPPRQSFLQQQEVFDSFIKTFNYDRPHQGINMKCPSDLYTKSKKKYSDSLNDELEYPTHDQNLKVTKCGSIYIEAKKKLFISEAFRHQNVGLNKIEDGLWSIDFMDYNLGYFDDEDFKLNRKENPFILARE